MFLPEKEANPVRFHKEKNLSEKDDHEDRNSKAVSLSNCSV